MARATFINAILSGKLDGSVYARNKGGAYVRTWVKPTNPKTAVQSRVRSAFTDASKTFRSFDKDVKFAWNYFASSYFKPKRIKPGVIYSGFNAFMSLFNTQVQAQANYISTEIVQPSGVTADRTNIVVSTALPPNKFLGQPITSAGDLIPVTLSAATLNTNGNMTATISLGVPVDAPGPIFDDSGENRQMGFIFYGNVPNSNSPTENICLGFTGFFSNLDGWTAEANEIRYSWEISDARKNMGKMWYSTAQTAIITAYAISNYGELSYIGNTSITVS